MMYPFLLHPTRPRRHLGLMRQTTLLSEFGCLLDADLPPTPLPPFSESEEPYRHWCRAVAEELLLRRIAGKHVPPKWYDAFARVSPTDNGRSLADLWERRGACALFPLASQGSEAAPPGVGHVWVFEGLAADDTVGACPFLPAGLGPCFAATSAPWGGPSWQLAGALAARAVQQHAPAKLVRNLATNWMVTGRVEGERIRRVELGNKLALRCQPRQWLIPRDNLMDVARRDLTVRSANDLPTAWNHISGNGARKGDTQRWPQHVHEHHLLIGGSTGPQLASILLTQCNRLVLWHSEDETRSREPACRIRERLSALQAKADVCRPEPELRSMAASDIVAAEGALRAYFGRPGQEKHVLFNVTSGNRLMSYAVQSLALLHPGIELIYRDFTCRERHQFVRLIYDRFPPYCGWLDGSPVAKTMDIDWEELYGSGHA